MTAQVQEILQSFDHLPEDDKRELVSELLRRSAMLGDPPLTNEQLVRTAEDLFVPLDRNEAGDA
ncbi:MAG: hypothetical protein ABR915_25970 [Thermoguttaceae bacterium]